MNPDYLDTILDGGETEDTTAINETLAIYGVEGE